MDEETIEILKKALELEEELSRREEEHRKLYNSDIRYGFEWYEVRASPQKLNKLVREGLLDIVYKSNKSTWYRLRDPEYVRSLLNSFTEEVVEEEKVEIPEDLFDIIVGYDKVKEIFRRSLESERPTHILMVGPPASAKSMFLSELECLKGAEYVLASRLTGAGLTDLIFELRPRYLLLDELDKLKDLRDYATLYSLMERGLVKEVKYKHRREITVKTWVFAGANEIESIPPPLRSRFLVLNFQPYSKDQFIEVSVNLLTKRFNMNMPKAIRTAELVYEKLNTRDPRDTLKVAQLMKQEEDPENVINLIINYRKQ